MQNGAPPHSQAKAPLVPRKRRFRLGRWEGVPDALSALAFSARHAVVSQILRPDVAAFLPPNSIVLENLHDAQQCVVAVTLAQRRGVITAKAVKPIASLPLLTSLNLAESDIDTPGFACLATLPQKSQIRHLDLTLPHIDSSGFAPLSEFSGLQSLLLGSSGVNAVSLAEVAKLPHLQTLHLNHCSRLDASAAVLCSLHQLRHLNLVNTFIDGAALVRIAAALTELEVLKLNHCSELGPTGVAAVATMTRLQHLGLMNVPAVNGESLAGFHQLADLTHLDVSWCRALDNAALSHIAAIPRLETLDLNRCMLFNAHGLSSIVKLRRLRNLNLACCIVDGEGLEHVAKLPQLQNLDLSYCSVTVPDLDCLVNHPQLRRLKLTGGANCMGGAAVVQISSKFRDVAVSF